MSHMTHLPQEKTVNRQQTLIMVHLGTVHDTLTHQETLLLWQKTSVMVHLVVVHDRLAMHGGTRRARVQTLHMGDSHCRDADVTYG